jgi:hypothetical protein
VKQSAKQNAYITMGVPCSTAMDRLLTFDESKGETRPDDVNRERRQAWAEQSKLYLDRRGNLKSLLCLLIVEGSLLVFTERHMHGLDRCATVSSVLPYSSGDCSRRQRRPLLDSCKAAAITIILPDM